MLITASCGRIGESKSGRIGEGGVEYGHVFRVNEVGDVRSMFPLEITEVTGYRIANQVYEGLVKFDQASLDAEPGLAERWEVNEDATQWTFYLRKDARFHDNECFKAGKGRNVTAADVEWCVRRLCTATPENQMFWLVADRLKGAQEYYDRSLQNPDLEESLDGVEVVDEYTVRFHLNFPSAGFLQLLGHNGFYIYPKEAFEYYGEEMGIHAVGTGPFVLEAFKPGELAILKRNENYWGKDQYGNELPYLDAVQVSFIKDKKSELLKFKNGELDMVFTLPIEMYSEVMKGLQEVQTGTEAQNFHPQVKPSMSAHYYAFQHKHPVFADARVRKAFNMAIDREALINYTLQGEGTPGIYGLIPPAFKKYHHEKVKGYTFDPEQARRLLAEAGYPGGKDFPALTLELASGGSNYELIAQVVQKMLEDNLNVHVDLEVMTMAQQLDNAESGVSAFWRDGWVADYPDPENFLRMFLSSGVPKNAGEKAYLNSVRYENPVYDSLYFVALRETDETRRYELYRQLDQILMDDAVIMPLYYEEFTRLIPEYVQNFPQNSIEYRDFSDVWISSENKSSKEHTASFMK